MNLRKKKPYLRPKGNPRTRWEGGGIENRKWKENLQSIYFWTRQRGREGEIHIAVIRGAPIPAAPECSRHRIHQSLSSWKIFVYVNWNDHQCKGIRHEVFGTTERGIISLSEMSTGKQEEGLGKPRWTVSASSFSDGTQSTRSHFESFARWA